MGEHLSLEKLELRRHRMAARRQLPFEQIAAASAAICARVLRLAVFAGAQHIVAYAALGDEVDPRGIVEMARQSSKTTYFPRVCGRSLDFLAAAPDGLHRGPHGVLEPAGGCALEDRSDVLFLVPGVVFDPWGGRIGRGGGYYDSGLAGHPRGFRLGLAVELQLSAGIPRDDWDEVVDAVLTERRLLWSAARGRHEARSRIEETMQ